MRPTIVHVFAVMQQICRDGISTDKYVMMAWILQTWPGTPTSCSSELPSLHDIGITNWMKVRTKTRLVLRYDTAHSEVFHRWLDDVHTIWGAFGSSKPFLLACGNTRFQISASRLVKMFIGLLTNSKTIGIWIEGGTACWMLAETDTKSWVRRSCLKCVLTWKYILLRGKSLVNSNFFDTLNVKSSLYLQPSNQLSDTTRVHRLQNRHCRTSKWYCHKDRYWTWIHRLNSSTTVRYDRTLMWLRCWLIQSRSICVL